MTPTRDLRRRLGKHLRAAGYGSRLYARSLKGRVPEGLAGLPEDIWPGEPERGNALFQGRYAFAGKEVVAPNEAPWARASLSPAWAAEVHGFAWLRHFNACAVPTARHHARELVRRWTLEAGDWAETSWRPDVLGRRLISWLCHAGFLLDGADDAFRAAFLASLAEQSRHLSRSWGQAPDGAPRLGATVALGLSGLCLVGGERRLERALGLLGRELDRQVQGDGGHVARNPSAQLAVMRDLVILREALAGAGREVPAALQHAIHGMAPTLRFFRHGDGGLALFNGGREERPELVDATLARAGAGGRPLGEAPHAGFQRLGAGHTLVLVDAGAPPPAPFSGGAHAGTSSFEMSAARERLIVNCGAPRDPGGEWGLAARATAAHSTLTLADTNSSELLTDGGMGRRAREVACERRERDGSLWLDMSHDGYARPFGLVHRRKLYLEASGWDLRGEDVVTGPDLRTSRGLAFAVRFHLHPAVRASLEQSGAAVLLRLASGAGWRLRAAGGALALEESVYLGAGEPRRAEQIVVSGQLEGGETVVQWALAPADKGT